MNNKKLVAIFSQMAALYTELAELCGVEETAVANEPKTEKGAKSTGKESPKKSKEPVDEGAEETKEGVKTAEELNDMPFNALKKYAASVGVAATGKREDIIARILGGADDGEDEDDEKSEEKKAPAKKGRSNKVVSMEEKKEEIAEYEETADDILEENDLDDVITELKEAGVKGVTKKNVKKKLIDALKKGLIDLEDDDDEDEDSEPADDADGDEIEIDESTYFEDYDDEDGANNPANVTEKARLNAMIEVQKAILDDIENEDLDVDEMKSFLLENSTEDEQQEIEDFDDDDVIAAYCEMMKRYIDDEGEDYSDSEDPYYVNGEVYAHAHKCGEADGEYVDEVSGETFELE